MGMDDNLDVPVIELGLAQINRHRAHTRIDLGESVSLGMDPKQRIEGFLKAVETHLAAGQESLQEVDPTLLEVLRDRGSGAKTAVCGRALANALVYPACGA